MARRNSRTNPFVIAAYLLITGLGIGWLTGLSVSPVVSIVITSVTGSATAIIAVLSGLEDKPDEANNTNKRLQFGWQINPLPLAMVVIGIALGAMLGIIARNQHWFGSSVSAEIAQWTSTGFDKSEVADRLFSQRYPALPYIRPYTQTISWIGGDLNTEVNRWTEAGLSKEEAARLLFAIEYPAVSGGSTTATASPASINQFGSLLFSATAHTECESLLPLVVKGDYATLQTELRTAGILSWRALPVIVTDTQQLAQIVEQVLCGDPSS